MAEITLNRDARVHFLRLKPTSRISHAPRATLASSAMWWHVSSAPPRLTSTTATRAPCLTKAAQVARPIPLPPPVTNAKRPVKDIFRSSGRCYSMVVSLRICTMYIADVCLSKKPKNHEKPMIAMGQEIHRKERKPPRVNKQ